MIYVGSQLVFLRARKGAFQGGYGRPSPHAAASVDNSITEIVILKVYELLPGRASTTHRRILDRMTKECGFNENVVPQMEDISQFLKSEQDYLLIFQK